MLKTTRENTKYCEDQRYSPSSYKHSSSETSLTSQVLHKSQAPENETLSGREGMSETNRATSACVRTSSQIKNYTAASFYIDFNQATDRGLLGVIRKHIQQLLRRVERSNVTRDEDRLPIEVYDGGNAGSVRVTLRRILLKPF